MRTNSVRERPLIISSRRVCSRMMRIDEKENWGGYFWGGEAAAYEPWEVLKAAKPLHFLGKGYFFLQMMRIDEKGRGGKGSSIFYDEIINGRSLTGNWGFGHSLNILFQIRSHIDVSPLFLNTVGCSMNTRWLWLRNSFYREGSIWSKISTFDSWFVPHLNKM